MEVWMRFEGVPQAPKWAEGKARSGYGEGDLELDLMPAMAMAEKG